MTPGESKHRNDPWTNDVSKYAIIQVNIRFQGKRLQTIALGETGRSALAGACLNVNQYLFTIS